jgi:hypothetical protein
MAKDRFSGRGALVKIQSGNTYNSVGLCTSITPPPEEKAVIDMTAMEDGAVVAELGIEQLSTFSFEQISDPADTDEALVDAAYASGNSIGWQILVLSGAKTRTIAFNGRVSGLAPTAFGANDPCKRTVTVTRTGAITDTVT